MSKPKHRGRGAAKPPLPPPAATQAVEVPQSPYIGPQFGSPPTKVVVQHQEHWSGPLPSPDRLAQFNEVVPGAAERILAMAELEATHRREMERDALEADARIHRFGQVSAFTVALACIAAAVWLAMHGHDWVAGVLGGTTLTTVVLAFLRRDKRAAE